ncbi:unnamed protein product [Heterobilharzia americana]|nr:unnamed protein product [Heterobilharzia americana]
MNDYDYFVSSFFLTNQKKHAFHFLQSVVVLKAYKNNAVSDHRCFYFSHTKRLDPLLQTTKLRLVNLISSADSDMSPSLFTQPISLSVLWSNFQDFEIIQWDPKLLVIVYDGELNPKLNKIVASHTPSVLNRSIIFLDADQFNGIILNKSSDPIADEIMLSVLPYTKNTVAYNVLIWILLYGLVMMGIALGSWMIVVNSDKILSDYAQRYTGLPKSGACSYLFIAVFLLIAVGTLVISYFFYDVIVYILIAMFVLVGAHSVSCFLNFITQYIAPGTKKVITCELKFCRILGLKKISAISLVTLPIGLSIALTWLVFRKDEMVGWPLQSFIGMVMVSTIISNALIVPSIKTGTLLFLAFLIYDVFFVFITPLFTARSSIDINSVQIVEHTRTRRSNSDSYMEAVATGSAGKSGEMLHCHFVYLSTNTSR